MATLRNKSVLITGASRGIGKALAIQMAGLGAKVSLMARSADELAGIRGAIRANGGHCEIFPGDVADEAYVKQTVEAVIKNYGAVDIAINNAGFGIFKTSEETGAF